MMIKHYFDDFFYFFVCENSLPYFNNNEFLAITLNYMPFYFFLKTTYVYKKKPFIIP